MALEQARSAAARVQHFIGAADRTRNTPGTGGNGHVDRNSSVLAKTLGWFSVGLGVAEIAMPRRVGTLIGSKNSENLLRSMGAREIANGLAILKQPHTSRWLWARLGGDAVDLVLIGNALRSQRARKRHLLAVAAVLGGVTALDVICSQRLSRPPAPIHITRSITIGRPANELYDPSYLATNRFSLEQGPRAYEVFKKKQDGCVRAVTRPS